VRGGTTVTHPFNFLPLELHLPLTLTNRAFVRIVVFSFDGVFRFALGGSGPLDPVLGLTREQLVIRKVALEDPGLEFLSC